MHACDGVMKSFKSVNRSAICNYLSGSYFVDNQKNMVKKELTPEEKVLLKEQQALAAQEQAEKKSEMALRFLKVSESRHCRADVRRRNWNTRSRIHALTCESLMHSGWTS